MSSHQWYHQVYPQLQQRQSTLTNSDGNFVATTAAAGPPMEFIQRAGEVVYLPRGWKHLTLNVGEAIGVGGQTGYDARQRIADARKALRDGGSDYDDFDAHYNAGVGLAHAALEEQSESMLTESRQHLQAASRLRPLSPDAPLIEAELLMGTGSRADKTAACEIVEAVRQRYLTSHALPKRYHDVNTLQDGDKDRDSSSRNSGVSDGSEATTTTTKQAAVSSLLFAGMIPDATVAAVHLKFARFYLAASMPTKARACLHDALLLHSNYPAAYDDLGTSYMMEGGSNSNDGVSSWREAAEHFRRATELAPHSVEYQQRLTQAEEMVSRHLNT
jgi:tetratricopeptide (TPR) repeat protein